MNITSLSSGWDTAGHVDSVSGASSYVASADSGLAQARGSVQQQSQNFKSLTNALQAGDLAGAQSAYATLQTQIQTASQSAGKSLFDPASTLGKDFQAIGTALQSGQVADAQSALGTFKQAVKSARHHHSQSAAATVTNSSNPNSTPSSSNSSSNGTLNVVA